MVAVCRSFGVKRITLTEAPAQGSCPFNFADTTRLMTTAARWQASLPPANSHDLLARQTPR